MDPVSHALVGAVLADLSPAGARAILAATVLGALAPDSDYIIKCVAGRSAYPKVIGINRWRYIVEEARRYQTGYATVWPTSFSLPEQVPRLRDPVVGASLQASTAQPLTEWARHPRVRWEHRNDQYRVFWSDLRYDFGSYSVFLVEVVLDHNLTLVDDRMGRRAPRAGELLKWRGRYEN